MDLLLRATRRLEPLFRIGSMTVASRSRQSMCRGTWTVLQDRGLPHRKSERTLSCDRSASGGSMLSSLQQVSPATRSKGGGAPHAGMNRMFRRRTVLRCVNSSKPVVVITGASTGIGRVTAQRLSREGWEVFAGVRRLSDGFVVQKGHPSIRPLLIDVTDEASVKAAAQLVDEAVGSHGVQGLVNNAGKVTLAPLEFMPMETFEDQLQVNLVGAMRVTQAFLPLLRIGQKAGRIINMSSQSGTVAFPLFAGYNASKFGLEAISDCLRYELYEQGIKVVLIKPGPVKTPIWEKGYETSTLIADKMPPIANELYGALIEKVTTATKKAENKAVDPEQVASVVLEALTVREPEARYMIGQSATVQMVLRRLLPDGIWDKLVTSILYDK